MVFLTAAAAPCLCLAPPPPAPPGGGAKGPPFRTEAPRGNRPTAKFGSRTRAAAERTRLRPKPGDAGETSEPVQVVRARFDDNATTEIGAASRARFSGAAAGGW